MRFAATLLTSCLLAAPVSAAQQPTPVPPPIITVPQAVPTVARTPAPLPPGSQVFSGNVQPARGEHRVRLEAGRRYTITADSGEFDTVLSIHREGGAEALAQNDDASDGTNAQINFSPAETGDYLIRVGSFSNESGGAYRLSVAPGSPLPPLITRAGRTERVERRVWQGELAASDPQEGGKHYEDYELRLAAGQSAMISLEAVGEWDPMLMVYSLAGRGGQAIAENDDAGNTLNSFLYFSPPEAGTYVVRVTSFGEGATGQYRLRISN